MNFLYPYFLFALFSILIPVIIHLFSFRRYKTVWFSNVNYLRNIKNEAQKRSKLKNLILLFLRILALSGLVFAFSQPYFPNRIVNSGGAHPVVAIYIDNSFSMNALSTQGPLLEASRSKALEIAHTYSPGTRFLLLTNDLLPQHQHLFNRDQFIRQVSEVKTSSKTVTLSLIRNRLAGYLAGIAGESSLTAYYLSDFQKTICDFQNFTPDSAVVNFLMPFTPEVSSNLFIDSCWMDYPAHKSGEEETLQVLIKNNADQSYQNLPLKFYLNDTLKALANFNIGANEEQTVELKYMNLKGGLHLGTAEISDFPFVHDNTWFLSYNVRSKLNALAIFDSRNKAPNGLSYLEALFKGDNFVTLEICEVVNLKVSRLDEFSTIFVLNIQELSSGLINELRKRAMNGATILFFPELNGDVRSYNDLLTLLNANRITDLDTSKQVISDIDWEHPVYEKVFRDHPADVKFPSIHGNFIFSKDIRIPETPLIWFRNKEKAISTQKTGDGNLVVFSFPLSPVNDVFARDILFVPTIYSLVINSLPHQKLSYILGKDQNASVSGQDITEIGSLSVLKKTTGEEFIPAVAIKEGNRIDIDLTRYFDQAGQYLIREKERTVSAASLNYDRMESELDRIPAEELEAATQKFRDRNIFILKDQERNFGEVYKDIHAGTMIWKWFVVLAIVCLLAEAMIIRFWK